MGYKDDLRKIFPTAEFHDEQPVSETDVATTLERLYTATVASVASHPNKMLATLGKNLWSVMHHRHVALVMHDGFPSMSFFVAAPRRGERAQGMIVAPGPWVALMKSQPLVAIGAVIFAGSQAVDFYNDRLIGEPTRERAIQRALAYEAEFLKGFPDYPLSDYQKGLLKMHPEGITAAHLYDYRPVGSMVS